MFCILYKMAKYMITMMPLIIAYRGMATLVSEKQILLIAKTKKNSVASTLAFVPIRADWYFSPINGMSVQAKHTKLPIKAIIAFGSGSAM